MEKISKVLFWCFIMGFAVMFIWLGMLLSAGDWMYQMHAKVFALETSKGTYMLLHYCGMGLWKMAVILFFCIPWLAIKIVGK